MPNPPSIIDTLRAALPLRDVVAETVELIEENGRWRGPCNLHPDRDRGLYVDAGQRFYHCFSCGRHGDVVRWTMELDGVDEAAAIDRLLGRLRAQNGDRPAT